MGEEEFGIIAGALAFLTAVVNVYAGTVTKAVQNAHLKAIQDAQERFDARFEQTLEMLGRVLDRMDREKD